MIESGYYPPGAEYDPKAPYNEEELPPKEIEVTVSVTLSKTMKVEVKDYGFDSWGDPDFSNCDLKRAVEEQHFLPQEMLVSRSFYYAQVVHEDCQGWSVDDFEVVQE